MNGKWESLQTLSVPKMTKAGQGDPFCVNYALISSNLRKYKCVGIFHEFPQPDFALQTAVNQGVILYSTRVLRKHAAVSDNHPAKSYSI